MASLAASATFSAASDTAAAAAPPALFEVLSFQSSARSTEEGKGRVEKISDRSPRDSERPTPHQIQLTLNDVLGLLVSGSSGGRSSVVSRRGSVRGRLVGRRSDAGSLFDDLVSTSRVVGVANGVSSGLVGGRSSFGGLGDSGCGALGSNVGVGVRLTRLIQTLFLDVDAHRRRRLSGRPG